MKYLIPASYTVLTDEKSVPDTRENMAFDAQLASNFPPLVLYTIGTALRAFSLGIASIWTDRDIGRNPDDEITVEAIHSIKTMCSAINNALSRIVHSPIGIHRDVTSKKENLAVKINQLLVAIAGRIDSRDRIATIDDDEEYLENRHMEYGDFYMSSDFPYYATKALIKQRMMFSKSLSPQYRAFFDLGLLLNGIKYKCPLDRDDQKGFQNEAMLGSDLVLKVNQYLALTKSCGTSIHEINFAIPDENDHVSITRSMQRLIRTIELKLKTAGTTYDRHFEKNMIIVYSRHQLAYEIFQDQRLDHAEVVSKFKKLHKIENRNKKFGANAKLPGSFNGVKKLAMAFQSKYPYLPKVLVRKGGRPRSRK